jgi:hypothetical protein
MSLINHTAKSIKRFALLASIIAGPMWVACEDAANPWSPCGAGWSPVAYPSRNGGRVSIPQGLWGDVWFWEGNFMPDCPTGTVTGVGREIRVHELTSIDDVEASRAPFFSEIATPLVSTAWSDANGFFQVVLPVGRYSIFVVEDTLFYANRFSDKYVFPVEVVADSVTGIRFDINYRAAY